MIGAEAQVSDTPSHQDDFLILGRQGKLQHICHIYIPWAILPFNHQIIPENHVHLQLIVQHPV